MDGYCLISLKDMYEEIGEDETRSRLSSFSCPLNKDVEKYLRQSAMVLEKQGVSPTQLVYSSYKGAPVLVGYFTIANKVFNIPKSALTSRLRQRLSRFAIYDKDISSYRVVAPLIAQLGKNFRNGYNNLISGDELLKLACDQVRQVQRVIGGKIVYLECEDKPQLIRFYEENGFKSFGKRILDRDETETLSGEYLIQMLKYLG